jgi:hypothetical protein
MKFEDELGCQLLKAFEGDNRGLLYIAEPAGTEEIHENL